MDKSEIDKFADVAARLQTSPDFAVFIAHFQKRLDQTVSHLTSGLCQDMVEYNAESRACTELEKVVGFCDKFINWSHRTSIKGE